MAMWNKGIERDSRIFVSNEYQISKYIALKSTQLPNLIIAKNDTFTRI